MKKTDTIMMNCRGWIGLFVWVLSFFSPDLPAQSFRYLHTDNGLSSRRVYQEQKDRSGFMWFFTSEGVDRFDGTEIRPYMLPHMRELQDGSLPFSVMAIDGEGTLWISLRNGQLYLYDQNMDEFCLRMDMRDYFLDVSVVLNHIYFDSSGNLWFSFDHGLYHLIPGKEDLCLISRFTGERVSCLVQLGDDHYAAGTYEGVYELVASQEDPLTYQIKSLGLPAQTRMESLAYRDGKIYAGTFAAGLFMIDISTGVVTSLKNNIPFVPVRSIKTAPDQPVLVGTDGSGLFCLDADNGNVTRWYSAHEDSGKGLRGNTVSDIFIDEYGCYWITTTTHGVTLIDFLSPHTNRTTHEANNDQSLQSDHVNVILEDREGNMWYGTNHGVSSFSVNENRWRHFLREADGQNGQTPVVLTLFDDGHGYVWAGSFGSGVWRIHKKSGRAEKIQSRTAGRNGVATSYVYSIFSDQEKVWISGIEGNVTVYDISSGEFTFVDLNCVGDIREGKDNTLILALCDGIGILDKISGTITRYSEFGGERLGGAVRCLLQLVSGDFLLATNHKGLIRFNPDTGETTYITRDHPDISLSIHNIIEDQPGFVWFTTENHLYRLDSNNNHFTEMNEVAGVERGNFNPNTFYRKQDGLLVVGTADGALEFDPGFELEAVKQPCLILTGFSLFYEPLKPAVSGSPLVKAVNETSSVQLSYEQNSFSLSFSSVRFPDQQPIRYVCKLDGFDKQWYSPVQERQVGYTNLSSGFYTLRIRAINPYTQEIYDERTLDIRIARPFWLSGWAWIVYSLIAIMIGLLIYYYTKHKIQEKQSRQRINSFVDVAHNIRTPVSLIRGPLSELEEKEKLSEYGRKSLSLAMVNTEKLFLMVNELLDFQRIDLTETPLLITGHDLYEYLKEKLNSFSIAASRKHITLDFRADFDRWVIGFDREKMDKIISNLLSNAIKYTQQGSVSVLVRKGDTHWTMEIKDTGIGIPVEAQKKLFKRFYRAENALHSDEVGSGIGLLLTRKLVRIHKGEITFTSEENKGSSFILTFPVYPAPEIQTETKMMASGEEENQLLPEDGKERILIVEDDQQMRNYLSDTLSQEYYIVSVENGMEALEKLETVNPDIIISDVIMPVMRGDELCRRIKSSMETSHISVILLTALSEKENVIQGLESGADDYVTKPFDTVVLKARIRNILSNRRKLRKQMMAEETPPEEMNYANELDKQFLDKAIGIIEQELADPEFSINEFCRELGMSRTSVYNKIKTLTGQGPNDFIRIIRLKKARELLKTKKYSIADVALMVGFSDPKYFSTSFKKQFGVSPSKIDDLSV